MWSHSLRGLVVHRTNPEHELFHGLRLQVESDESTLVDSVDNFIDGSIGGGTNQDLFDTAMNEHGKNPCDGVSFSRTRRALYEKELVVLHLSHFLQSSLLRGVELGGMKLEILLHFSRVLMQMIFMISDLQKALPWI